MGEYLRELQRRNVFRAVAAYIVVGWLLLQVSTSLEDALELPAWFDAVVTALLLIGFPVVVVFSWVYELTPDGLQKTSNVQPDASIADRTGRRLNYITVAGVVLLLGVVIADRVLVRNEPVEVSTDMPAPTAATPDSNAGSPDRSIAVLPFVAMTSSQDDEFFADGLSEEILNVLANVEGLKVAGRTSAFYYKGRNEDLRVIADALGVAHVLEGSIRRSGDRLRVTAQLIKAGDGFHLWSETFDRADGDTFAIQDEIATNVARALQAEIMGIAQPVDGGRNIEAQNLYLVAQAAIAQRTLPDTRQARDLYAQASLLDPGNPRYLAGYAEAVALQYWNYRDIGAQEAIAEAGTAIENALAAGEPSSDTLAIAGLVQELRVLSLNDSAAKARALDYYERAARKEPNNIRALQWLASIYLDINEPEKARAAFARVVEIDPLNSLSQTGLANALAALGRFDEARAHLYKLQTLFPRVSTSYRYAANIEWDLGHHDRYIFWMERAVAADPNPLEILMLVDGYSVLGWADKALEAAERFRETSKGTDISRQVQALLDRDFETLALEAMDLYKVSGAAYYSARAAWAEAVLGRCAEAIPVLETQYPSLRGEVIEYLDNMDLGDAVLLAHCKSATGARADAARLTTALLASPMLSDTAIRYTPYRRLIRVATHSVAGDIPSALADLATIDSTGMPLGFGRLALPVDELPVFENLAGETAFQHYASQERFQIGRQARLLATGETSKEVVADIEAAGYRLQDI
ncbi:MAG: tetratricopeptide repeat protein [Gammaproteobacteria bacterium]|nr:tetratricopeptide repeat protein [Gammaproteobacteria bacterium]MDH4253123.1 tetratricopeptide repeat protein [Gammaproteobacteria bacterium]MDH5308950.1 tetratricopeptide repeat protein [Gammaproteobacteria bacterium]